MTTTITARGQVTLPKDVREKAGLKPGDKVTATVAPDGSVRIEAEQRHETADEIYERLMRISQSNPWKGPPADELLRMTRGDD
jgi:antitoxin PrlF